MAKLKERKHSSGLKTTETLLGIETAILHQKATQNIVSKLLKPF